MMDVGWSLQVTPDRFKGWLLDVLILNTVPPPPQPPHVVAADFQLLQIPSPAAQRCISELEPKIISLSRDGKSGMCSSNSVLHLFVPLIFFPLSSFLSVVISHFAASVLNMNLQIFSPLHAEF